MLPAPYAGGAIKSQVWRKLLLSFENTYTYQNKELCLAIYFNFDAGSVKVNNKNHLTDRAR